MQSRALALRDKFKEYFLNFLRDDKKLKEAFNKTYGPRIYRRQMTTLSRMGDLTEKIDLFRFIKSMCPGIFISDTEAWNDYVALIKAEKNDPRRDRMLYLMLYFEAKLSVPFILDNLVGGKETTLKLSAQTRETLLEVLGQFSDEAIPYILRRTPLYYPELARVLVPYYIRVGSGSFKTLFHRIADLFGVDEEEIIDPFIRGFLDYPQVPTNAHPFLVRFFIVPCMDRYPQKADYFLRKILSCSGVESIDEHRQTLLKHLGNLFRDGNIVQVETALDFIKRFPITETASFLDILLKRFPNLKLKIFDCFQKIDDERVRDIFLNHYPNALNPEKDSMLRFLLAQGDHKIMDFLDTRYRKGDVKEQALILKNLWVCPCREGMKWIEDAFERKNKELVAAALDKLHYIGNFFSEKQFNNMILTAHQLGIPINRGILNPLTHLLNEDLCRKVLTSLSDFPLAIKADRLSFAGYFADEHMYKILDDNLDSPVVGNEALEAMIASRDARAIDRITTFYDNSDEETRSFIVDTITRFQDHRFREIIRKEAEIFYRRVDSYTPGDAFIIPVDREFGFEILSSLVETNCQLSVQLMLELARYGGEKAVPILIDIASRQSVRDIPRKRLGISLALYIAGQWAQFENLEKLLDDDYLGNYLIYLMHDTVNRADTILLPTLEKYQQVDFGPFVDSLFRQLNNYYPWDPMFDQVLKILGASVSDEHLNRLSRYLLGSFVDLKVSVLNAFERLQNRDTLPILKDTLDLLEQVNVRNLSNLPEIYYRIARLMYKLGETKPFEKLKKFYRTQLFEYLKNPMRFIDKNLYFPEFYDILDEQERIDIFLKHFGSYLADPGDLRFTEEAFLKMIEGIDDQRFVKPIVNNLRLCQAGVDLIPSLQRLKELTGKTYGVDYARWKKFLEEEKV